MIDVIHEPVAFGCDQKFWIESNGSTIGYVTVSAGDGTAMVTIEQGPCILSKSELEAIVESCEGLGCGFGEKPFLVRSESENVKSVWCPATPRMPIEFRRLYAYVCPAEDVCKEGNVMFPYGDYVFAARGLYQLIEAL